MPTNEDAAQSGPVKLPVASSTCQFDELLPRMDPTSKVPPDQAPSVSVNIQSNRPVNVELDDGDRHHR